MTEPSTNEAIVCRSCWIDTAVSDGLCAECLAARPAVDVEGIARVLGGHVMVQRSTHERFGFTDHNRECEACGFSLPWQDWAADLVAHQAAAVVAYLAGEGR